MSKINKSALLYSILLLLHIHSISAQQLQTDSVSKKFDSYRRQVLHEKIYAHLDRTLYLTGETLWTKIYYVDASLHKALDISKVAYLEVIDKDNDAILQTKIELKDGKGDGSLFLPASLTSGNYTVRVYTNWMKNFSPEFYFHQSITIINSFVKLESTNSSSTIQYDAQFFPEGGNLVAGLESKVAFRVTDSYGKGIDFNGAVVNNNNDTLIRFRPLAFGIGHFDFTPSADVIYKVIIRDSRGIRSTFQLPEIKTIGYVMNVQDKGDFIEVRVISNSTESNLVYLFVHARQIISKIETKISQSGTTLFQINKKDLQDGISHVTIFDAQFQPVAERLYFKQPERKLNLLVQSVQQQYEPRRKVTLNLQANFPANLSLSVYKTDSLPSLPRESIQEYLWLTSELKGKIESPEYYFSNAAAPEAIDNLMLTHGWRRFNWADVLTKKTTTNTYVPEYRHHFVTGKIKDATGSPAVGIMTYMASPDKIINVYGSRSNTTGDFFFEVKNFYGERKMIVQTNTNKDSTYHLIINSPFSNQFSSHSLPAFKLVPSLERKLLSRNISMQLQNIYFKEESNQLTKINSDSVPFYGRADETYRLDDFTRFPIMEEVMREYVPGVLVRKRKDGFHFMVLDNVNKSVFREDPMILLDGVPVFDVDKMMAFDPLKVKKLDVVDREYYLGPLVFPGIVSYSTYQGDLRDFEQDQKALFLNYEGLQLHREFYSPKYENQKERDSRMPDQRTLIYWNPNITIAEGQQSIEFYTSDVTGNYEAVVEGLSKNGIPGNGVYTFSVKRSDQ